VSRLDEHGGYRILSVLGEDPRGVVYLAEQTATTRRRVALRVMKPGRSSQAAIARFEAQRQALMALNHPNIAKVLDGGASGTGRLYVVTEYVDGLLITRHCDRYRLSFRERIELFVPVCHAVQHAHQKGLIHGDLNPSRVLVTVHDGEPRARIIDFGIARAVEPWLNGANVRVQTGRPSSTPAYMSPEQADMTRLDIDTRTDLYSLGVMLYEMLVGVLPFEDSDLAGLEALYAVLERSPPTLSRRFDGLGDRRIPIAAHRDTDVIGIARQLRGDLEWIVGRAMEKDRSRRYQTASELALDLRRYLTHEPVPAHAPAMVYRAGGFVRRLAAAVLVAAAAILVGSVVATTQRAGPSGRRRRRGSGGDQRRT
jgi:serine/threonine protein kinase